jgi:hypothetical protein
MCLQDMRDDISEGRVLLTAFRHLEITYRTLKTDKEPVCLPALHAYLG